MKELSLDPNDIDVVLITHAHIDHVAGLRVFAKKYQPNIYLTEKHKLGGFTFKKIDPKDMGAVYENLSRPYDDLDELKSELLLRDE